MICKDEIFEFDLSLSKANILFPAGLTGHLMIMAVWMATYSTAYRAFLACYHDLCSYSFSPLFMPPNFTQTP